MEWFKKLELVCNLLGGKQLHRVIPLHLTEGVFVVYQKLTKDEKSNTAQIKEALITAFAVDRFMAYEQFEMYVLHPDKTTNVYLADL